MSERVSSISAYRLFRLLAVVWVGSQLTVGYAVAPTLFSMLDRISAGAIAARLFFIEAIIGAVCGIALLILGYRFARQGAIAYKTSCRLLVLMLACLVLGYFVLQPFMSAMRTAALNEGSDVSHSVYAMRFGILHGISSVFYLIQSLLGVLLVWKLPERHHS